MKFTRVDKFRAKLFINFENGDSLDLSSQVRGISSQYDYANASFPLHTVSINTTSEVNNRLINSEFSAVLRIGRYEFNEETSQRSDIPMMANYAEDIVLRILDKSYEVVNEAEDDETNKAEIEYVRFLMSGIPQKSMVSNSKIVNNVFKEAYLEDAMISLVSDTDVENLFIDRIDNRELYRDIIVPPLNIASSFRFLEKEYNLYNSMSNIFFDSRGLYIYKLQNPEREFSNILRIKSNNDVLQETGMLLHNSENDDIELNTLLDISFRTTKYQKEDVIGSNTIFSSYDDQFNTVMRKYENDVTYEKSRYFWNKNNNRTSEFNLLRTSDGNIHNGTFAVSNSDPDLFRIDTRVSVSALNPLYTGDYSITSKNVMYTRTGDSDFVNSIVLEIIRI